jgi:hypothetical protein
MIRRVLVMSVVCMVFMGMSGFAIAGEGMQSENTVIWLAQTTTTSSTSEAQAIQNCIIIVRNTGAALYKLAGVPIPSGLTATQKNAFVNYNTWLKTKSSQLSALADKWEKQPPSAQTYTRTLMGKTSTVTVSPLGVMNTELQQIRMQIMSESNQMVQKTSVLKPRHDALVLILQKMTCMSVSTSEILQKIYDQQMQVIRNISK